MGVGTKQTPEVTGYVAGGTRRVVLDLSVFAVNRSIASRAPRRSVISPAPARSRRFQPTAWESRELMATAIAGEQSVRRKRQQKNNSRRHLCFQSAFVQSRS